MFILKLRSRWTVVPALVLVVTVTAFTLLRVDAGFTVAMEIVLSGNWGDAPGEFGRGVGVDGRPRGPQAFAVDAAGHIVVADSINGRLQVFSSRGEVAQVFAVPCSGTSNSPVMSFSLLQPSMAWGTGFRPTPRLAAPVPGATSPAPGEGAGEPRDVFAVSGPLGTVYVTDIDLAQGAWRETVPGGGLDMASGPLIYLLAGWSGLIVVVDGAGTVEWRRDLAAGYPGARPEAGYLLSLSVLPEGSVLVTGYQLLADSLGHFVGLVPGPDEPAVDLAQHSLTRDGKVEIKRTLPIQLEVESLAVGTDGRLYIVAALPPEEGGSDSARPFRRDVWVFSRAGVMKGKVTLECEAYTKHLKLVGVDARGLLFARLGSDDAGSLAVFDRMGRLVLSVPLSERSETADVCLGQDGHLYTSEATDEVFRVIRYTIAGHRRVVWRWGGG